jgi:nitroimidazol reductase NimA-like FMN-containing flavoprotein (pyridoxamine 5'-phosphate oxidase superfamily)
MVMSEQFPQTEQNRVNRHSERGRYDKAQIYPIIDEALICHVGIVEDEQPVVIPTIHARICDTLYLHGAVASRMLKHAREGHPVCVTITLIDGIVFARSVFNHSMNYRSVVVFGHGRLVADDGEKMRALTAITEHMAKGRWAEARNPTRKELAATLVIAVPIESAAAKVRSGPPGDDEEDLSFPVWAGVLPLRQQTLAPVADPKLRGDMAVPEYIAAYERRDGR